MSFPVPPGERKLPTIGKLEDDMKGKRKKDFAGHRGTINIWSHRKKEDLSLVLLASDLAGPNSIKSVLLKEKRSVKF